MAPKYTLIYFNGRGMAEISRLILAQARVEYVDRRITANDWPQLKKEMPFGHLPVLDVNGVHIGESRAIARYLAKEHGLGGKNALEAAQADAAVDAIYDLYSSNSALKRETDAAKKAELLKTFWEETVPTILRNMKAILENNKFGYLVGDSLTWADITIAHTIFILQSLGCEHGKAFPNPFDDSVFKSLLDLQKKVFALPAINDWIEKRPHTDF